MEEIEISSWLTLDAIKKEAEILEVVGNLQSGHFMSVFCKIEDDYLELCYSDASANYLRSFEDREELEIAMKQRKEEEGETPYEDTRDFEENFEEEVKADSFNFEDEQ